MKQKPDLNFWKLWNLSFGEVIAGYCAGGDFDAAVARLAAIGYALEDALKRA